MSILDFLLKARLVYLITCLIVSLDLHLKLNISKKELLISFLPNLPLGLPITMDNLCSSSYSETLES